MTMIAMLNDSHSVASTCTNNYYDEMLDNEIIRMKVMLREERNLREAEREKFSENQANLCIRQHYCTEKINKLLNVNKLAMRKPSPCYAQEVQKLSSIKDSPYIIARETELCQALHRVEVLTAQLRIFTKHHKRMVTALEETLEEEICIGEDIEAGLSNDIAILTIDIAGIEVENNAKLDSIRYKISCLRGKSSGKEDGSYDRRWSLARTPSTSSVVSNSSSITSEASSIFSDASSIVSNFFRRKEKKSTTKSKAQRRNSVEKRITKVSSYFVIDSTAEAA